MNLKIKNILIYFFAIIGLFHFLPPLNGKNGEPVYSEYGISYIVGDKCDLDCQIKSLNQTLESTKWLKKLEEEKKKHQIKEEV